MVHGDENMKIKIWKERLRVARFIIALSFVALFFCAYILTIETGRINHNMDVTVQSQDIVQSEDVPDQKTKDVNSRKMSNAGNVIAVTISIIVFIIAALVGTLAIVCVKYNIYELEYSMLFFFLSGIIWLLIYFLLTPYFQYIAILLAWNVILVCVMVFLVR